MYSVKALNPELQIFFRPRHVNKSITDRQTGVGGAAFYGRVSIHVPYPLLLMLHTGADIRFTEAYT